MPVLERSLRVLVLSWNYPTRAPTQRGLRAERLCNTAANEQSHLGPTAAAVPERVHG
jgi:hypothetical protein